MHTLSSSRTAINCTQGPGSGAKIVIAPSKGGIFTPLIQGARLSASLSSKIEMKNDIGCRVVGLLLSAGDVVVVLPYQYLCNSSFDIPSMTERERETRYAMRNLT